MKPPFYWMRRVVLGAFVSILLAFPPGRAAATVDRPFTVEERKAYVGRHDPVVEGMRLREPLSVGNGRFAFTVDVTGAQTFGKQSYANGMPLETLARWAWTEEPNPANFTLADVEEEYSTADGTRVRLPTRAATPAGQWLRRNPTDHPLGMIGFVRVVGSEIHALSPEDISHARQRLDLWTGTILSEFVYRGERVAVTTRCHPERDAVAIEVEGIAFERGELRLQAAFPRGHDRDVKNTPDLDWSYPESHDTLVVAPGALLRRVDGLEYEVFTTGEWQKAEGGHRYLLAGYESGGVVVGFARKRDRWILPTVAEVRRMSEAHWAGFWSRAAVLDLAGSRDPRAPELERRVVLSQYLLAVQCASEIPPQESGLTCSTWYGKHHTEMIWWHAAHFSLWGQPTLLARNLEWYLQQLPNARRLAGSRNLEGARWAKMVGPEGRESPGGNPLIVWNQPHPIYLSVLMSRHDPEARERYRSLVTDTAKGLASMLKWDQRQGRWVLGPPLWIAQEIHDPAASQNPAFELAYWGWALEAAATWVSDTDPDLARKWRAMVPKLSPLPQRDGLYVALESHPDTWDDRESRHDHPSMLMALGFLPQTPAVDMSVMASTLDAVKAQWDWETKIWGWDYPMIAMTATRLGRPHDAVDFLLKDGPNNRYLMNGHCPQSSDRAGINADARPEIAAYLPANGALLAAVALMVMGWDGAQVQNPGFPKDGSWQLRAEGWSALP